MQIELIAIALLAVWVLVLTVVVFWNQRLFKQLAGRAGRKDLVTVLKKVLDTEEKNTRFIAGLEKDLSKLVDQNRFNVQKIGVVRFNPFDEVGGDHSFSVALTDGTDTGLIITGLHTRARTRVYIKEINKGKSKHSLSAEEKKAMKVALQ